MRILNHMLLTLPHFILKSVFVSNSGMLSEANTGQTSTSVPTPPHLPSLSLSFNLCLVHLLHTDTDPDRNGHEVDSQQMYNVYERTHQPTSHPFGMASSPAPAPVHQLTIRLRLFLQQSPVYIYATEYIYFTVSHNA